MKRSPVLPMWLSRRKFLQLAGIGAVASFLQACSEIVAPTPPPLDLPTPSAPAEATARAFLRAWQAGDFVAMYAMLTPTTQAQIKQNDFVKRYQDWTTEATIQSIKPELGATIEEGNTAQTKVQVTFETVALGTFAEANQLPLRHEFGRWGILWSPSTFFVALGGNSSLKFYPTRSTRGNLYDRSGQPLAVGGQMVSVSVWPAELRRQGREAQVVAGLAPILNLSIAKIKEKYADLNPEWTTYIADISSERAQANANLLQQPGVQTDIKETRDYPQALGAAHVVGYAGKITKDELPTLYGKGYREDDSFGRVGLEKLAESYIGGKRGGRLAAVATDGSSEVTVREQAARQSFSVYTTIDLDLQKKAETAMENRVGAAVVMDVKTGSVLAMVSRPSYDPNIFVDKLRQRETAALLNNSAKPLLNRATLGAYPPGSVWKVVTLTAALERGNMGPSTPFNDPGFYDGVPGFRKFCWLWKYGRGHGTIGLAKALTASCDVTFYQVGARLNQIDPNLMPGVAYAFGFGSVTGSGLAEAEGNVSDPKKQTWVPNDPVDMAIGQDTMLVTPLQIVSMMAAVANGGTLWKPRLLDKVSDIVSGTEQSLPGEKRGVLPLSATNLQVIRDALRGVTTDQKDGTAYYVFAGSPIISAGKTGTAQTPGTGEPHSWFAGYAPADDPEIAVAVIAEHAGEGSAVAAPIFKKIVEAYFKVDVTPTPTPAANKTPTANRTPTLTPTPKP
ncbi:MAG TPA: penicillin-binding protein 2 [Anaerolineae bacterium]